MSFLKEEGNNRLSAHSIVPISYSQVTRKTPDQLVYRPSSARSVEEVQ